MFFSRTSRYLPLNVKRSVYFAFFHSHVSYLISIWGSASSKSMDRLEIIQKRVLRNLYGLRTRSPSSLVYATAAVLKVGKVAEYFLMVLIHKMINVLALSNTGITFGTDLHGYDTRCKEYLRTVKPNSTAFGCKNLYNIAAQLYNKLPKNIKNLSTLKFKKQLKKRLMLENVN